MRPTLAVMSLLAACLVAGPAPALATGEPTDDPLEQEIQAGQDLATDEAVLDSGHVDLGPRYVGEEWTLLVHDDTRVEGSVWRPLDRTVVRVTDAALQEVPDDPAYEFLGVPPGTGVHVVPQTQHPDVAWLGWNTQDPRVMEAVDRGVTLSLERVDGPGDLVVYLQDGGFGEPDVLWDSRQEGPQDLWVDVNTHTHANWVFTEPGTYLVTITASATLVDGSEESASGTVRFAVGDGTDPQEALAASAAGPGPDPARDEDAEGGAAAGEQPGGGSLAVPLVGAAVLLLTVLALVVWRGRRVRARALAAAEAGTR